MTTLMGATIESNMLTKRGIEQIQKTANRVTALEMRGNLKHRFEGRKRGLKFKRRSAQYNKQKRKKHGHIIPLLASGDMRRSVITRARVTATKSQGRVISTTGARGFRSAEWRSQVRQEIEQIPNVEVRSIVKNQERTFKQLASQKRFHKRRARRTGKR